jgi:hypothetical protein
LPSGVALLCIATALLEPTSFPRYAFVHVFTKSAFGAVPLGQGHGSGQGSGSGQGPGAGAGARLGGRGPAGLRGDVRSRVVPARAGRARERVPFTV